jgi:hypothetical protein
MCRSGGREKFRSMDLNDQQKLGFCSTPWRTYFRLQNGTSWRFSGRPCRSMLDLLISKTAVSWRWPVRCSKIATDRPDS